MDRDQRWDGYPNARDLGGLPTPWADSGRTSFGRVFRGPATERLSPRGWAQLYDAGVRTVVDLRNGAERPGRDGIETAAASVGVTVLRWPLEDPEHEEFMRRCGPMLGSPEYYPHQLELLPGHVATVLQTIANAPEGGVLVHCGAGRDRTGLVVTLLLLLAGVDAGAVAADYELSVRAMEVEALAGRSREGPLREGLEEWVANTRDHLLRFVAGLELGEATTVGLPGLDVDAVTCLRLRERLTH